MKRAMAIFALALLALPGTAPSLAAQILADDSSVKALARARSLKCSFPWYSSADWDADEPKLKTGVQDFAFHIDGIDRTKRAARLIGNAGAEDLVVLVGDDSVSFVEQTPAGAVNVTTVYAWRNKAGSFKAVHSRHTSIGGPSPSQNYGQCLSW
jgi:hypothetical protein